HELSLKELKHLGGDIAALRFGHIDEYVFDAQRVHLWRRRVYRRSRRPCSAQWSGGAEAARRILRVNLFSTATLFTAKRPEVRVDSGRTHGFSNSDPDPAL